MRALVSAVFLVVLCAGLASAAGFQAANITVDGEIDDWKEISLWINDALEDDLANESSGADIDYIKTAYSYDRTRLHLLWKLTGPADEALRYRVSLDSNADCSLEAGDAVVDISFDGTWVARGRVLEPGASSAVPVGLSVNGPYLEVEIPCTGLALSGQDIFLSCVTLEGSAGIDYAISNEARACIGEQPWTSPVRATSLSIQGPAVVHGQCLAPYASRISFDHGPDKIFTEEVQWDAAPRGLAVVDRSGRLRTSAVDTDTPLTLTASFQGLTARKDITVTPSGPLAAGHVTESPAAQTKDAAATRDTSDRKFMHGYVTFNGIPQVAMVLVNGKYDFSDQDGYYEIADIPLDPQGKLTAQIFCGSLQPLRETFPPDSYKHAITARDFSLPKEDAPDLVVVDPLNCVAEGTNKARISGKVKTPEGVALNVMALANGQYMFTQVAADGAFDLPVPLDPSGQVTLQVFCAGRTPYRVTVTPSTPSPPPPGPGPDDDALVGVWYDLFSASEGENTYWHFYANGKFVYDTDQYTPHQGTTHQIYQPYFLHGTYTLNGDVLVISPQVAKDRNGNTIPTSSLDNCWQFTPHYSSITFDGMYVDGAEAGVKAGATGYTQKPNPCSGSTTFFSMTQKTQLLSKTGRTPGDFVNK